MKPLNIALTGDNHYDLFQNLALLNENLLTDRALEIDKVFKEIIDRTLASGIKYLFVLGDLQHRRNIRSDAINALVYKRLKYAKEKGLIIILIIGNHDQAAISGLVHAFSTMTDVVRVVDKPEILTIEGIDFYCLPYEEYKGSKKSLEILLKQGKNPNRVLLGHVGIMNAAMDFSDHASKEPLTVEDLQLDKFIYSYFGHYHLPQRIARNALYVGSPCQFNLGDAPVDRGYTEVEIGLEGSKYVAKNELKVIDSPKFLEVKVEDYNAKDYVGKHYIKVTGANRKQVIKLQEDENVMSTTGETVVQTVDEEKTIKSSLSWVEMISKYIKITEPNKRKHKRLVKVGKGFIE